MTHGAEGSVGGVEISGTFFPAGTSVGCMPSAVHFNPKGFSEDAEVFDQKGGWKPMPQR